ncbi:thiol-disulfide oxidoreductase DCC family protein [Streptomyces sp. NPDC001339]|uniref:thiol-disulfide oxidoreductase DCC family protein n=1 Tax=Streptomyces sp. NPDC001339 TaxID=3364563 RepID=UPI0036D08627
MRTERGGVSALTALDDRGLRAPVPVRRLTVLYDADCPLCTFVRNWLVRQPQLVPLDPVPAGSGEAQRRFPALDHAATLREITVVGDAGQVYTGAAAWVVCLWSLAGYRPMSHRFSSSSGAPLAKAAVLAAAKYREAAERTPVPSVWRPSPAAPAPPWGLRADGPNGGWVYDPVHGWTTAPPTAPPASAPTAGPDACADGCAVPD